MKFLNFPTLLSMAGAVAAGALLFWTSQNVQQAEDQLAAMHKSVAAEERSIRVLRAEWDYLNQPQRLEALALHYLGLSSAAAFNVTGEMSDLPEVFIPALPQNKPLLAPQPAVFRSAGPRVPVPHAKPARADMRDFGALLKELSAGEGGHDQ